MIGFLPRSARLSGVTAAILAGGLGTRLRSAVADRPKVLAPVAGRPFLAYLLDSLAADGVRKTVLLTGFRGAQVRAALGNRFGEMNLVYSEEPSPLGTGGAPSGPGPIRFRNNSTPEWGFLLPSEPRRFRGLSPTASRGGEPCPGPRGGCSPLRPGDDRTGRPGHGVRGKRGDGTAGMDQCGSLPSQALPDTGNTNRPADFAGTGSSPRLDPARDRVWPARPRTVSRHRDAGVVRRRRRLPCSASGRDRRRARLGRGSP